MNCRDVLPASGEPGGGDAAAIERYMMERPGLLLAALDLMERYERGSGPELHEEPEHAS